MWEKSGDCDKVKIRNIEEFLKFWTSEYVTVEEERLVSGEWRKAVMRMMRTVANIWTLSLVWKTLIPINERWF